MHVEQRYYEPPRGWVGNGVVLGEDAHLAFLFGGQDQVQEAGLFQFLRTRYPEAHIIIGTTSGEICDTEVTEHRLTLTAIRFDHTEIEATSVCVADAGGSYAAGCILADRLQREGLVHVFVVSDGQHVNGTDLARGFNERLPKGTLLTGGLAGDGDRFERTLVGLDRVPEEGAIVAVGFYGDRLQIGFGSSGGWAPFGPIRRVTRSEANTLYELDGRSALELYKQYLGDLADGLPGAALRFPLCMSTADGNKTVVRTILSIGEDDQSMRFAGDIPVGAKVRFMRASYEDLVDGAANAAEHSIQSGGIQDADLAICVSCVGRKIVLGQRAEEETEIVRDTLGQSPVITGFYSYGELAPPEAAEWCELHNQTMTITLMKEV